MTTRLNPPDWDAYDSNMLINVGDMKYYYENFTDLVDKQATTNKLDIQTLDGRVAAIEHSIPVGPGGKGAFIDLGGVPGSYPSAQQMVEGDSPEETSFLVVARTDGIYFYNPKSKVLIPPKSGGGAIAVHGQFPQIFDAGHSLTYNGRAGMSGVYTAKSADIGLGGEFTTYEGCKLLVVVNDDGEEYQTAFSPDGTASRIFRKGSQNAVWGFSTGGGGGSGTVDPIVIQEIKDRLTALEAHDHIDNITELKDVILDPVTDANGLLYMDVNGKIRGGKTNPMLSMGAAHVHTNAVGAPPVISGANISGTVVASNNVIIFKGALTKQVNLPNVVAYNTYQPATSQVREGRTTFIVNSSDVDLTVRAPSGGFFYVEGNMDSTNGVIPPKTVFVYNPAILDNGSGVMVECWIYMGNYPLRASDLNNIILEIQNIKNDASDLTNRVRGLENAPKPKFSELTDTPNDYRPGRVLAYNMAGDGITSIEAPTRFEALSDTPSSFVGNRNKMVTVNHAEDALEFTNVPNLVPIQTEVNNLHNEIISISNEQNIQNRDIEALDTRVETLENAPPAGSDVLEAALADGSAIVRGTSLFGDSVTDWDSVTQVQAAKRPAILFWGNANGKSATLPDIVDKDTTPLPEKAVRPGRIMFITNRSTTNKTIKVADSCLFCLGGAANGTSGTDYVLKPKNAMVLMSYKVGSAKWWVVLGVFSTEETTDADAVAQTADWKNKVETGDSAGKVNSNCMYGAMQIADANLTSTLLATCTAGYVYGSTARTCTLPQIVDVNSSSVSATQARFGKQIRIGNMSTQPATINVQGNGRIYKPDGNWVGSVTIAAGKYADFHAVWWPGGGFNNFAWVMMQS